MKYRIGNRVINADHIVKVRYHPAHNITGNHPIDSQCDITLTNVTGLELDRYAVNEIVTLYDNEADAFWDAYIGDAYNVVV